MWERERVEDIEVASLAEGKEDMIIVIRWFVRVRSMRREEGRITPHCAAAAAAATAQPPKRPSSSSTRTTEAQEHLPHSTIRPILTLWRIRSDPLSACHSSSCSEELPRDYNRNRENANSGLRVFISSSQLCTVCRGKNSKLNETHHPFPGRSWKKTFPLLTNLLFLDVGKRKGEVRDAFRSSRLLILLPTHDDGEDIRPRLLPLLLFQF